MKRSSESKQGKAGEYSLDPSPVVGPDAANDVASMYSKRNWQLVVGALSVSLWAAVFWVFWSARDLRPIADDYCWAAASADGLFSATSMWYQTWTGDLTNVVGTTLLVGYPLAYLPLSLGSAVPFAAASLAASAFVALVSLPQSLSFRQSVVRWLTMAPLVCLLWWTFWWLTPSTGVGRFLEERVGPLEGQVDQPREALAIFVTHWQNINSSYVILTLLSAGILWILVQRRTEVSLWSRVLWLLAGLLIGLTGPVAGVAFAGMAILVLLLVHFGVVTVNSISVLKNGVPWYVGGAAVGVIAAFTSPGTRNRVTEIPPLYETMSIWRLAGWAVSRSAKDLALAAFFSGAFVAYISGALAVILLSRINWRFETRRLVAAGLSALALSLLYLMVLRLVQAMSAFSAHHVVPVNVFIFIFALLMGMATGNFALQKIGDRRRNIFAGLMVIALPLVAASVLTMVDHIETRRPAWEAGPAPVRVVDIEVGWVEGCWIRLAERRNFPTRLPSVSDMD